MKLKKLLFCLAVFALLGCLASCGEENDAFKQAEKNGCTVKVTYNLGDGTVNGNTQLLYYVAPDTLLPELGKVSGTYEPVFLGYHLLGYYTVDANGAETDWDFSTDRVSSDTTIYARWEKDIVLTTYSVKILYGENNEQSYSLSSFTEEKPTLNAFREQKWEGHTLYGFYYDAGYTQPVVFPYTHPLTDENTPVTIYAKYLDGVYKIIRKADDFDSTIEAGAKYYIDADIDFAGTNVSISSDFSGEFIGNGHKITGLKVSKNQQRLVNGYGLFNSISSGAVFRDITFDGIEISVILDNGQNNMVNYIGGFAGIVKSGVTFDNVTVSGKLTCNKSGRPLGEDLLTVNASFGECDSSVSLDGLTVNVTVETID